MVEIGTELSAQKVMPFTVKILCDDIIAKRAIELQIIRWSVSNRNFRFLHTFPQVSDGKIRKIRSCNFQLVSCLLASSLSCQLTGVSYKVLVTIETNNLLSRQSTPNLELLNFD